MGQSHSSLRSVKQQDSAEINLSGGITEQALRACTDELSAVLEAFSDRAAGDEPHEIHLRPAAGEFGRCIDLYIAEYERKNILIDFIIFFVLCCIAIIILCASPRTRTRN